MKKKPKSIKKSFLYIKLYLSDLKDINEIFNEKLFKFNISDDNSEYDDFNEFLEINKNQKKIKKLFFNGLRNINIPSEYNENKKNIEFNLEFNRFSGAVITTEDDENIKEIELLITDVLNRNRMVINTAFSWLLNFVGIILGITVIILFLMMLLSLFEVEVVDEFLKNLITEYGEVYKIYFIFGLLSLYTIVYPNKIKIYLFEKRDRLEYLRTNKWKIIWEILKYLTPIITFILGKYFL